MHAYTPCKKLNSHCDYNTSLISAFFHFAKLLNIFNVYGILHPYESMYSYKHLYFKPSVRPTTPHFQSLSTITLLPSIFIFHLTTISTITYQILVSFNYIIFHLSKLFSSRLRTSFTDTRTIFLLFPKTCYPSYLCWLRILPNSKAIDYND